AGNRPPDPAGDGDPAVDWRGGRPGAVARGESKRGGAALRAVSARPADDPRGHRAAGRDRRSRRIRAGAARVKSRSDGGAAMRLIDTFRLRLRSLFRGAAVDRELDEELRYHLDQQIEEHIARGLSPARARREALLAMGGLDQRKEECR